MNIRDRRSSPTTVDEALKTLLEVEPDDVGCEQTWELIHRYCDLALAGEDPEAHLPGVAAHLRECEECAYDYQGLLDLVTRGK